MTIRDTSKKPQENHLESFDMLVELSDFRWICDPVALR